MPYGIVYLPQASFHEDLMEYSMRLGDRNSMIMHLGEQALPHLTLIHAEGSYDAMENCWRRVSTGVLDMIIIKLTGLMVSPIAEGDLYVPQGGIYIGIEAIRRPNLNIAHHAALSAAQAAGASPIGATAEDFRPHITLGVLRKLPLTIAALPPNLLTNSLEFYLAFGFIGMYGTLQRVIRSCR